MDDHRHNPPDLDSDFVSDNPHKPRDFLHSLGQKRRLFGLQKSVHHVLGGGNCIALFTYPFIFSHLLLP